MIMNDELLRCRSKQDLSEGLSKTTYIRQDNLLQGRDMNLGLGCKI
jgi:hypothetical protein